MVVALDKQFRKYVLPSGTHFTAESTEVIRINCHAQAHNILMETGLNRKSL